MDVVEGVSLQWDSNREAMCPLEVEARRNYSSENCAMIACGSCCRSTGYSNVSVSRMILAFLVDISRAFLVVLALLAICHSILSFSLV